MSHRERAAVLELARPAVEVVAPEELPLLEATAAAWPRRARRDEDELLGFGLEAVVAVVSIAAVTAAQAVVELFGSAVVDAVSDEASSGIRGWIGRRSRRRRGALTDSAPPGEASGGDGESAVEPLSCEQLRMVRQVSRDRARAAGVSAEQAELIADAIVGRLSA
ncbi:hypothetical protein ABZ442_14825 [Streptomyces triculaminicus]|uniref:hypothetical protein n=1 Tax=Streptomyces triculaminicus TaxID=2816232 RepID=UPI0033D5E621